MPVLIDKTFSPSEFNYEIQFTKHRGHIRELAANAASQNSFAVAVAGGDGSVNEAAQSLINTNTALAVIPSGSGNGFANHFLIPQDPASALQVILKKKVTVIDTLSVNGLVGVATAGVGFDALIAHSFALLKKRGFLNYVRLTLREIFSYREMEYLISSKGKTIKQKAFAVTLANTSEYGNHAVIAPHANPADGLLDVCILKNISPISFPVLGLRLFTKTIHRSCHYENLKTDSVIVSSAEPQPFHIDGEPMEAAPELNIRVVPKSLRLLIP